MKRAIKTVILNLRVMPLWSQTRGSQVAILRYHSVLPPGHKFLRRIGEGIVHSIDEFDRHMELLANTYCIVTMDEVSDAVWKKGKYPCRCVCVTFDDGFRDNFEFAAPIMEKHGLRGTFYLTAGCLPDLAPPWFCRLKHAFDRTSLTQWKDYDERIWSLSEASEKRSAILSASRRCACLTEKDLDSAITEIEIALGSKMPWNGDDRIMLLTTEIRDLCSRGHVIGSHGMEHPNIAQIDEESARREIAQSKQEIRRIVEEDVRHFSYPSPILQPHHTPMTRGLCEEGGYETAVTCDFGTFRTGHDSLAIRRISAPKDPLELHWEIENAFLGRTV